MPTKRAVLAELTRRELRTGLDFYELQVPNRRVKAQLVDALARSRKARVEEVLQALSRDRLKALCRVFQLDDSGRKKADLVARLVGPATASSTAASRSDGSAAPPAAPRSRVKAPAPPADVASVAGPGAAFATVGPSDIRGSATT